LKKNDVGIYEKEYEYVSPCGKELNFVNVADKPIVFQQISSDGNSFFFIFYIPFLHQINPILT